jgi:hypothetical protein
MILTVDKQKYSEKILSHCYIVNHKAHIASLGMEAGTPL